MKGTLNKLTPEKFERLLQQLVDVVTSAEILHATISLVFESAVAQPTFVAMYADLCDRLSKVCYSMPLLSKSNRVAYPCACHLLGLEFNHFQHAHLWSMQIHSFYFELI